MLNYKIRKISFKEKCYIEIIVNKIWKLKKSKISEKVIKY